MTAKERKLKALEEDLPGICQDVLLKKYTTFCIGGPAKYFFAANTTEDIVKAVRVAKKWKINTLILSGGSNVLVSDKGFNGLVINLQNADYEIKDTRIEAGAGVEMATLVQEAGKLGLAGLEWAGGLPGTLGGAIRGNAGAFEGEIKDSVVEVTALDNKGKLRTFSLEQCKFAYRTSTFKRYGYIVVSAVLKVRKGDKKKIQAAAREHIKYREERHPLECPNAGSVFKNCDLRKVSKDVRKQFEDVVKEDPFPVIPTAALIAHARLQGMRVGDAEVSKKHPNYIINRGNAHAADVIELIAKVKREIKKRYGVVLEEELSFPH